MTLHSMSIISYLFVFAEDDVRKGLFRAVDGSEVVSVPSSVWSDMTFTSRQKLKSLFVQYK